MGRLTSEDVPAKRIRIARKHARKQARKQAIKQASKQASAHATTRQVKSTASTYLRANRMRPALEIHLLVDVYPSTSTATVSGRLAWVVTAPCTDGSGVIVHL